MSTNALPTQSTDFPGWYGEVVRRAELAENSAVRGAMVIKPYGYAIWEAIQRALDDRIKATGHENFYFPLFVPVSLLAQEGELVKGFAPEVAVVTEAGGKQLEEPLAVRPTSEALIWSTYARWVQSYRDLPLLYNQWANVVRWELRPRLFLRTSEFLWQEGHTAHETEEEAVAETLMILNDVYADTIENVLAIPVLRRRKSESERFPGAVETYTLEALMRDGKALQAATSHYLGQGFARTFDVHFTGRDGAEHHPYATSWGASTRLVGGVVMAHGDDRGLRLPPLVAPQQVVIVPIYRETEQADVLQAAAAIRDELKAAGVSVRLDDRVEYRPGFKFNEWELKGAPVRIEVGGRDLAAGAVTVARRDTGEKPQIPLGRVGTEIQELLSDIQTSLFRAALHDQERRTLSNPGSYPEMIEYLREARGFVAASWLRQRGMRGARQGRGLSHDPVPAARRAAGALEHVHLLWPAGRALGSLGTSVLAGQREPYSARTGSRAATPRVGLAASRPHSLRDLRVVSSSLKLRDSLPLKKRPDVFEQHQQVQGIRR
jgi:prolyl-tRNA synthetase